MLVIQHKGLADTRIRKIHGSNDQKSGKSIQFSRFVPLLAWNFRPIDKII